MGCYQVYNLTPTPELLLPLPGVPLVEGSTQQAWNLRLRGASNFK